MSIPMFEKLKEVGVIIDELDICSKDKDVQVKRLDLTLIERIENRLYSVDLESMENDELVIYHYTNSNYHAILKCLAIKDFELMKQISIVVKKFESLDDFVFKNYSERIEEHRKAIRLLGKETGLSNIYISQIFVNLANTYLEMGRVMESIQELMNAQNIVKGFPMARANLAMKHYSLSTRTTEMSVMRFLMDRGLEIIRDVADNAEPEFVPLDILENFYEWELYFERSIDTNLRDVEPWSASEDVEDQYNNWSVKRNLTLNYINVIYPFGNVDNLHMPNMGLGYFTKDKNMEYYAWFNTIKQEYNMARYWLFQISKLECDSTIHESQKHNVIINTLDYPAVGYKTELLKTSLKTAFSVLDKIGLFCCHFHNRNMPIHRVDFHKWYKEIEMHIALGSPFNALYWLSQDLDMSKGEMRNLRLLRNYLEHRYLRVLESYAIPLSEELSDKNKYEYKISYVDLEKKAYETLILVRNAIFYMANGFNLEFNKGYYDHENWKNFIPLTLGKYNDEWKN